MDAPNPSPRTSSTCPLSAAFAVLIAIFGSPTPVPPAPTAPARGEAMKAVHLSIVALIAATSNIATAIATKNSEALATSVLALVTAFLPAVHSPCRGSRRLQFRSNCPSSRESRSHNRSPDHCRLSRCRRHRLWRLRPPQIWRIVNRSHCSHAMGSHGRRQVLHPACRVSSQGARFPALARDRDLGVSLASGH